MEYFDILPKELILEILYYLPVNDIINIDKLYPGLHIRANKQFWRKMFKKDGFNKYISYMESINKYYDYLEDYKGSLWIHSYLCNAIFYIPLRRDPPPDIYKFVTTDNIQYMLSYMIIPKLNYELNLKSLKTEAINWSSDLILIIRLINNPTYNYTIEMRYYDYDNKIDVTQYVFMMKTNVFLHFRYHYMLAYAIKYHGKNYFGTSLFENARRARWFEVLEAAVTIK